MNFDVFCVRPPFVVLAILTLSICTAPAFASEPFPTCDPVSEYLTDPTAVVIIDRAGSALSSPERDSVQPSLAQYDVEPETLLLPNASAGSQLSLEDLDFLYPAPSPGFCAEWNPEFAFNGHRCCTVKTYQKRTRRGPARGLAPGRCASQRRKNSYCDERTEFQVDYADRVTRGEIADPLAYILERMDRRGPQSYCTVNNGFLVYGRAVVGTERNRLLIRNEHRCLNYGTDRMAGMLEWVGRRVARQYSGEGQERVRVVIGDISAPKGGCLAGRPGRKGHASHTSGQDVDFAFLNPKKPAASVATYNRDFDPSANWWLIKQVFKNPLACVKVIFLDRKLIRKLAKAAYGDPDWDRFGRFIRHSRGHANHFHVRIGTTAGDPGCVSGLNSGDIDLDDLVDPDESDGESFETETPGAGGTVLPAGLTPVSGEGVELKN